MNRHYLFLILGLAAVLRFWGIGREPLWWDEVNSVLLSSGGIHEIMRKNAQDVHPPLYYVGLAGWRNCWGQNESSLRSYSLVWSLTGIAALFLLSGKITGNPRIALTAALFASVNPMDIYYAQEARMYAQTTALITLAAWALLSWTAALQCRTGTTNGKWLISYVFLASAVLYSHYLGLFALLAQGIILLIHTVRTRRFRHAGYFLAATCTCGIFFMPWMYYVYQQRDTLYHPIRLAWMRAHSLHDIYSFLFSEYFWGELSWSGRIPLWPLLLVISLVIVLSVILIRTAVRNRYGTNTGLLFGIPKRTQILLCSSMLASPVILIGLTGLLYHPIYYKPRFTLFVLPYFLILCAIGCFSLSYRSIRYGFILFISGSMFFGSVKQLQHTSKTSIREISKLWKQKGPADYIEFFPGGYEMLAAYYFDRPRGRIPRDRLLGMLQQGDEVLIWVCRHQDFKPDLQGSEQEYLRWLESLGPSKQIGTADLMLVEEIRAEPPDDRFPALDFGTRVLFSGEESGRYLGRGWQKPETDFRWTNGKRALFLFSLAELGALNLRVKFNCLARQHITLKLNGVVIDEFDCAGDDHMREIVVPDGIAGRRNRLEFLLPDAISPTEVCQSLDTRVLAMAIHWIELGEIPS